MKNIKQVKLNLYFKCLEKIKSESIKISWDQVLYLSDQKSEWWPKDDSSRNKSHQDLRIIQKMLTNLFKKEITANLYQVVPFFFKILLIKLSVNTKN